MFFYRGLVRGGGGGHTHPLDKIEGIQFTYYSFLDGFPFIVLRPLTPPPPPFILE